MAVNQVGGGFQLDPSTGLSEQNILEGDFDQLIENAGQNLSGDSAFFLLLQQRIARESQAYQALSNVQKSRDDARSASIRNIA